MPTFLKSALRAEIFLKICDCCSKNAEIRSKTAILGGLKCEKSRAKAVFCGLLGAVFHRETPSVSCVKRPVDQIEIFFGGILSFKNFLMYFKLYPVGITGIEKGEHYENQNINAVVGCA